jgi:hypothetical protein
MQLAHQAGAHDLRFAPSTKATVPLLAPAAVAAPGYVDDDVPVGRGAAVLARVDPLVNVALHY